MDLISLGFYALICGLLSLASPLLQRFPLRFAVGVVVGLSAAAALPMLRDWMGIGAGAWP